MLDLFREREFYYADRKAGKVYKCIVLDTELSYPLKIYAVNKETGETFTCYRDFGCYGLDQYEEALADSQVQEERYIK